MMDKGTRGPQLLTLYKRRPCLDSIGRCIVAKVLHEILTGTASDLNDPPNLCRAVRYVLIAHCEITSNPWFGLADINSTSVT
jgi:hypothetical protein